MSACDMHHRIPPRALSARAGRRRCCTRSCTCATAARRSARARPRSGPRPSVRAPCPSRRASASRGARRRGRCRAAGSSASPCAAPRRPTARTGAAPVTVPRLRAIALRRLPTCTRGLRVCSRTVCRQPGSRARPVAARRAGSMHMCMCCSTAVTCAWRMPRHVQFCRTWALRGTKPADVAAQVRRAGGRDYGYVPAGGRAAPARAVRRHVGADAAGQQRRRRRHVRARGRRGAATARGRRRRGHAVRAALCPRPGFRPPARRSLCASQSLGCQRLGLVRTRWTADLREVQN